MPIRTTPVQLGTGMVPAIAIAPRLTIGFWDSIALTLRGWTDARRYAGVSDEKHTHALFLRNSGVKRREDDVVKVIDAALSMLDSLEAEARVLAAQEVPSGATEPSAAELAGRSGRDRQDWAQSVRASRSANAQSARVAAEVKAATVKLAQLEAERRSILAEGEDVRRLWADAFEMRAARYTRARFGIFGRRPGADPQVPSYQRGRDPHVDRFPGTETR